MFSLYAFVLCFLFALCGASPVPVNGTVNVLEKRITHTGRGTWFNVGLGNCGQWNSNSDPIVAISKSLYDQNGGSNCGQWLTITNTANGKTANGYVRDSCPSCGYNDIDLSPSLFQKLGSLDTGVLKVSWHFQAKGWKP
ncbi:RlpA-like double-psi beta-barrel-protein domain-containing protein-containing protein [Cristinia sonorae]|uniref:RlpA-like double-psi beta-barrel-protein domain-containing protein-containing protein n=1 Tax=Cristinia sonorae TaxID=1940300 RepID=A0A8K0UID3_9AGAR|nr:RlpA-like double-psi beta-barrel-protein domain-containing protein-containing protein [Cristinia sonorae]